MTQWHDKLQDALAQAPVLPRATIAQPGNTEDPNDIPHDDDPVVSESPLQPHQIPVYGLDDLRALEAAGGDLKLWTPNTDRVVVGDFVHEARHLQAAKRVGRGITQMVVSVYGFDDGTFGRTPSVAFPEWETTRLGHALTFAHPRDPSETDMQGIESLGYPRDLSLLAQKARARAMPVPRSVKN